MRIVCLDTPSAATLEAIRDIGFDAGLHWKLLLYSLIFGAALAVVYDVMRVSRVLMTPDDAGICQKPGLFRGIVIFLEDVAFFIIAALAVTVFVFHTNHGDVRGFVLIGTLGGFILYLFTVGRITVRIARAIVTAVTRFLGWIFTPIFMAAARLFTWLYRMTLGRALASVRHRYRRMKTNRIERELILFSRRLFYRKGSMDESGTTVNTCKTRDLHGIHLHDHHFGKRADTLQQPAGGAREARGAHRSRAGRH